MPELITTSLKSDASIKGYWPLNDSLLDSSGGGFTMTNVNSASFGNGRFGRCIDFGTANSNQNLKNTAFATFGTSDPCTIGCWVKINTQPATDTQYFLLDSQIGNGTANKQMRLIYEDSGGTKRFLARVYTNAYGDATYNFTLQTGQWYFVCFYYNGTTGSTLYLNGASVATGTIVSATSASADKDFWIGCSAASTGFASAAIDDAFSFSRQLTTTEMLFLYSTGTNLNNYNFVRADSGISVTEKIR